MTWRSSKSEGGGCLHDYASHVVDLMNFMVGPPRQVPGASCRRIFSKDVEDAVYATFRLRRTARAAASRPTGATTAYRKMSTTITVYGTKGKIVADRQECRVFLREGADFETYRRGLDHPLHHRSPEAGRASTCGARSTRPRSTPSSTPIRSRGPRSTRTRSPAPTRPTASSTSSQARPGQGERS